MEKLKLNLNLKNRITPTYLNPLRIRVAQEPKITISSEQPLLNPKPCILMPTSLTTNTTQPCNLQHVKILHHNPATIALIASIPLTSRWFLHLHLPKS